MSRAAAAPAEQTQLRPVANGAEAELLMKHLMDVMDALLGVVEEETKLVRGGDLAGAARLEPSKTELTRLYFHDAARLKSSQELLKRTMPDVFAALRERHDLFHALLQINLTVLATAHAVSESIMRGVSDEMSRNKATPNAYGASGRAYTPPRSSAQPLAVSRVL
jgi:hypothetical protein